MAEPLVAPSPPQQQHENVNITQVFSPDEIWATPSFTSRFLYLEQEMVTTCAQQRHQLKAELRVRPGMVCVYHRAATDRWYRVRVLTRFRRSVGPCCQVQLLDYGEQQTVLDVDLYRLPEPYCDLNHLPAQAIRIRLAGLCPMQLGFVVSDQGAVLGTMERASRWSEAACALVRRLLTPGTPCRLEWTRCSRAGVRHGRLRVLGDAEADIAQRLIAEQVAQARPEHEPSSSSECDEPSLVTEPAPLRHTEVVLDSDDSSEPDGPPPARPDTGAAAADSAVFWAEQRRAEEEFHRLQQQQRNETAGDSTDHDDKRSRLQRRLMGLLVPENASAGDQGTRPSVQPPPASQSPGVGVLSGTVRAPLMPGRGRGALTSPQIPAPGVRAPTTSPSPEPAETSGASDLAAALRQLRSESSSADEAGRPSPTLLPAGQTSSARMAAQRRAADEQRQRQYEARLQRRAGRAAPPERAETVRPSLWGDQLSPRNARPSPWDGQSGPYDPQPRSPDSQLSPQAAQTRPWDDQPSPRAAEPKPQDLQPRLQDSQPRQQATQPKPQTAQPRLTDAQLITQDAQPRSQAAQASLQDSLSSPRDVQPILKTAQPRPPAVQTRLGDAQSSPWDVQPKPQAAQSILKTTQPTQLRQAANAAPQAPQAGRADGLKSKIDAHQPIPDGLGPRTPPTAPGGPIGDSPLQENSPQSPAVPEQRRSTGRFERVSAAVWRQRLLRQAAGTRASADQSATACPGQSATGPAEKTKGAAGPSGDGKVGLPPEETKSPDHQTKPAGLTENTRASVGPFKNTKLVSEQSVDIRATAGPSGDIGHIPGPPESTKPVSGPAGDARVTTGPPKNATSEALPPSESRMLAAAAAGLSASSITAGPSERLKPTTGPPEDTRVKAAPSGAAKPPEAPSEDAAAVPDPTYAFLPLDGSAQASGPSDPAAGVPCGSAGAGGSPLGRPGSMAEKLRRLVRQRERPAASPARGASATSATADLPQPVPTTSGVGGTDSSQEAGQSVEAGPLVQETAVSVETRLPVEARPSGQETASSGKTRLSVEAAALVEAGPSVDSRPPVPETWPPVEPRPSAEAGRSVTAAMSVEAKPALQETWPSVEARPSVQEAAPSVETRLVATSVETRPVAEETWPSFDDRPSVQSTESSAGVRPSVPETASSAARPVVQESWPSVEVTPSAQKTAPPAEARPAAQEALSPGQNQAPADVTSPPASDGSQRRTPRQSHLLRLLEMKKLRKSLSPNRPTDATPAGQAESAPAPAEPTSAPTKTAPATAGLSSPPDDPSPVSAGPAPAPTLRAAVPAPVSSSPAQVASLPATPSPSSAPADALPPLAGLSPPLSSPAPTAGAAVAVTTVAAAVAGTKGPAAAAAIPVVDVVTPHAGAEAVAPMSSAAAVAKVPVPPPSAASEERRSDAAGPERPAPKESPKEPPAPPPRATASTRPSLEHLMTCSELRDRPAPPRPAADAVGRSDSALLRVLVHGRRRVAPYWRTEQMPFADMVMQKLRPMAFRPSRVQAYLWSAAACYRNIVCVGQAGSGKTLGYLLAVVNSLLDPDTYEAAPTGHGPLCLVLVPSWRRGRAVQELCHAVTDSLRCLPLLVHGGGAEAEQEVSLLNGCDLLVGTPACLLRLLRRGRDTFIQLSRVCHLVLDDADLLVEHSAQAVEQLALAVFSMWRARSEEALSLPQQVIAAASHWTPGLQALTRLLPDSVVATSCYLEQLVWARPRVFTHVLEDDQKEQKLLGLLQTGLHRHRLVVFTSTDESAQRLARLLHCQSYPVLLADGDQLGASLTELERCWRSSSGDAPDVLVVSDTVVAELTVRDAAVLVHFDVPTEKRTQLGLRCSYMMDSYPDRLVNPEAENRCVVHLFVSPSAAEKIGPHLPQLLVRLGAEVPPALAEAARRRSGPRRLAALCDRLLAAGRCPDRLGCERRHWLHPTADAGQEDIPQYGEVTVSVSHVLDAATLAVRLLSVRDTRAEAEGGDGRPRQLEDACCRMELDVCAHYSLPANRVCHELPQVGDLCGLLWDDMFVRVQVTSLETGTETCAVLLVDFGNTETVQRARLLSLPAELAAVPPQAVTAHLCGVEPIDGDWEWTEGAVRLAETHLRGQVAVGKVVLALGRHLWLSPLVRRRHHQLYQTSATLLDPSLASQLLERGFGQRAPRHLESLYELCRRAGLPLRDQWKPADRRKLYQTEFLPLVAPLKTNSSVNITNVTSPADFYVQRNDVFPQYEQLMADLNRWAEGPEPARLASYRHRVRQHCVAQFPEDGRWYRARVLSVTTDEAADTVTYEVLYTDVGDRASVDESLVLPLPERFAKRLPLQAIRCELAFCSPTASDGVWSEEAGDLLYQMSLDDEELWIPYHCQVVGQTAGRHRVVLYDPQRRGVHHKLEEAGLATVDEQGLLDADPPEFPPSESSLAAGRSLDSDDSDSDSELRLAEQRAGVTYRDVLEMAPKEDGVPVMEFGEFEVVGFPFSRLSREMAERSASSADSIEVIGPECADLAAPAAAEQPPPPVQITELTGPSAAPAPDTDGDWEIVPPRQAAAAPAPPPPPPPLAFGAEPVRTPRVTWWQDGGHVRLCVHLSDARQPLVDIQPTHFHFSCEQAGCRFVVAIDLFSAVRPQDSFYQVLGAHVQVKLRKEKALSWRRLTAVPVKARWLQHDLEHLAGGDSSSDETYLPLVSPAPAPLPLEALRRGRAPQPEPAEGAAVTSSSEDSDEDMEHGFGGAAGASDLKLLNDPEAVRDLLQPDPWASGGL
ncbi:uncharacterized protein LOC122384437 isoform X2 [Amphibalanus amphitrite]|uniref:uncharacterized protein LOC122384437 isoform X2 n=1 Tax=Amphibalanus amphitrite TaxID=1232801 RepID=UPI001C8FCD23|nr:uncharacterized protein LOC122384437 isoform X2 [Amphibalanus amphitrite]